ncbi:hypothetical protein [Peribacillus simplex]|uniref:hypothetical protein n=1 Tax=Peribacillus simplex TaxID=1478 RepID=UPI00162542EF|nr:hypothetical protein [Peribacillus simplex]
MVNDEYPFGKFPFTLFEYEFIISFARNQIVFNIRATASIQISQNLNMAAIHLKIASLIPNSICKYIIPGSIAWIVDLRVLPGLPQLKHKPFYFQESHAQYHRLYHLVITY